MRHSFCFHCYHFCFDVIIDNTMTNPISMLPMISVLSAQVLVSFRNGHD